MGRRQRLNSAIGAARYGSNTLAFGAAFACCPLIWTIRQAITRSIAVQARTIRVPVRMIESIEKMNHFSRAHLQGFGAGPDIATPAFKVEYPRPRCTRS
jgi:hypothetical protein